MKILVNGRTYTIREAGIEELREVAKEYGDVEDASKSFFYGLSRFTKQEIILNKDLVLEEKMSTLAHELCHVYMWCYGFDQNCEYNCEQICNLVSACYNFVGNTVYNYFSYIETDIANKEKTSNLSINNKEIEKISQKEAK